MHDVKPWWMSRTIWAALAMLILGAMNLVGIAADDSLRADLTTWVEALGQVIAGGIALWGRIVAVKRIDSSGRPSGAFLVMLSPASITALLLLSGCSGLSQASLDADAARYRAVEPVIQEHVERHPAEAERWADFLWTWEQSIEARQGLIEEGMGR